MIKKFFSLLLTLCMVLVMMPVVTKPVTVQAAPVQSVRIGGRVVDGAITGGVVLDSTHKYYHNGENGGLGTADANSENAVAEFDANAGTLTLNGLNIDTDQPGIWWKYSNSGNHDLTIVLADGSENTINNSVGSGILGESGLTSGPSLTIKGSGKLSVTGKTCGIWVWRDITIQETATVIATGETKMGICNNDSAGKITIKENAEVTATGGEYGIGYDNTDLMSNIPVIQGGTVTMTGGTAAVRVKAGYTGTSPDLSTYTGGCKVTVGDDEVGRVEWDGVTSLQFYKYIQIQQGAHTNHCICGASHSVIGNHSDSEQYTGTWQAWSNTASLPDSVGYYYLTADVTITSTWSPADGTVLCLNGHTITGKGTSIISVGGGTFTLTNCKNEGSVKHAEGESGKGVENKGTFNMYGGEITNNKADSSGSSGGGVENARTFNMYGGEITNNKADSSGSFDSSGGGVRNGYSATFNMYGGTIANNTAKNYGGGVENAGTFNMYGGEISNNKAGYHGGGVDNEGTFTMQGGQITTNETVQYGGGGVRNGYSATFTMQGGEITNNQATTIGGGVSYLGGFFNVSGNVKITGNKNQSNASSNLYLGSNQTITIESPLTVGALIGVTVKDSPTEGNPVVITSAGSSDYSSFFRSDNTSYQIEFDHTDSKLIMKVQTCSHSGLRVTGQAATCTTNGWIEYYQCSKCSGYFTNSGCTTPIPNLESWKAGDGKISARGHDWTYSAAGATLTASCNGKASCGMVDQTLTLTINDSLSYTGSELTPASFETPTDGWTTNVSSPLPTIKYYKTETIGGTEVSGNPKDVGYYYASATVGTGGNSATVVKAFEIQKAEAAFSTVPVGATTLIYNTSAQNLLTTQATTSDGTIQYAVTTTESQPEDSAFGASTPTGTDAGTYYVYYKVKGDANHNDKICDNPVMVTIAKAPQSVSAPTASEPKATQVTLNAVAGQGSTTYAKNTTDEAPTDPSAWQTSNVFTALTKNTTYYFFAKCAGNDNYLEGTSTGTPITTSDLTSSTITGVTAKDGVNTTGISYGTAITPDMLFTGTPVLENAENPVTAYKYEGVSSTEYLENTAAPTAVGTYKLVIVMNDDNYYGTQDIPFTIVKSSPAAVNATGVAPTGSNVNDGKIQVTGVDTSLYTLEYKGTGETTSPADWTDIEGTEVTNLAAGGTYVVRIKETANNNASPETQVTIPAYVAPPAGGGGGISGGGSSTPSTDKNNDSKTETTTLPDGTKVETSTTTDKTTGATTVEEKKTALDGTVTETKTTTQKDGSSQMTSKETRTDGSTIEINTTVDTEGTAQSVVLDKEVTTGDVLVIQKTEEPDGEVSHVLATLLTEEATIVKAKVERAEALANMKNIPYGVKVLDENGNLDYKVRVNTGDVKANQTLYVYKYDSKTKSFGLVQEDYQKVKADEKANIFCDFENLISTQRYQLVTKSKAGLLDKKILATVKAKIGQKSLKVNQSTLFKLDEKLNLENVSTIKYSTSDKQVVKVSKAGKITGKNTGTADIKATITLINGKTKTVRMKIKVK